MVGIAEEAPGAYKDAEAVVLAAEEASLAKRVARLRPQLTLVEAQDIKISIIALQFEVAIIGAMPLIEVIADFDITPI
jgi:hypothetical protein